MPKNADTAVQIANYFREDLQQLDAYAQGLMQNAWRQTNNNLLAEMEAFAAKFEPGDLLTPAEVMRMERYHDLQVQIVEELARLEGQTTTVINAGSHQAVGMGAAQANQTMTAVAGFNRVPVPAVENVMAIARAGQPLHQLLQPMYGLATKGAVNELIAGVALGWGPRKIAQRMANMGLTDGYNHLLLVARDQFNRAHRTAAQQTYQQHKSVTKYVRRCARQPGRTCIACIVLDGKVYDLKTDFEEHPQGRCTLIPVVTGVVTPDYLGTGPNWFEGLSEQEQIATMGQARWDVWKSGELPWDKMVQRRTHPVWGTSVSPSPLGPKFSSTRKKTKTKENNLEED